MRLLGFLLICAGIWTGVPEYKNWWLISAGIATAIVYRPKRENWTDV